MKWRCSLLDRNSVGERTGVTPQGVCRAQAIERAQNYDYSGAL